ncbi:MAG: two-component system response regulator NarL [Gammaproteobacteria bacterium]
MSEPYRARLVVIDDHPLFRRGVADLIDMSEQLELVGSASSGPEGIDLVLAEKPDLVLLDLNMKEMGGVDVLRNLKKQDLDCRIVILTVSDNEEDVIAALRAGADGYLLKDMEPEAILDQLHGAAEGRLAISQNLTELLARALRQDDTPKDIRSAGLTDREREILSLIAQGKSNKLVARELEITEATVKVHVKNLLKKLRLRSRVEAAVWWVEQRRR